MADQVRAWDLTDKAFTLFDATKKYGIFTGISGGDMSISMVPYTIVDQNGVPTERYIPGQISFAPITLTCALSDVVKELIDWFMLSVNQDYSKDLARTCSIGIFRKAEPGKYLLRWDLIRAIPSGMPSVYSYNAYTASSSVKFKLTLRAEDIKIVPLEE
jgi:hypothetical protein